MDYLELRSWRDICEYLNSCWYKFDECNAIARKCPNAIAELLTAEGRSRRQSLWDRWLIQFIHWGSHPILSFRTSSAIRSEFKQDRGWALVSGWEAKIDFLEQLYVLERDESVLAKPWQAGILRRIEERRVLEERDRQFRSAVKRTTDELRSYRLENNLCPHCGKEQVPLMMDCTSCYKSYEAYFD